MLKKPDLVKPLRFLPSESNDLKCIKLDIKDFPSESGVYILRFNKISFPRFKASSNILKVGQASKGFCARFTSYNGKQAASSPSLKKLSALHDYVEKSWSEFYFMWFLAKIRDRDDILVEFYFSEKTDDLERLFLAEIIETNWELPPLNFNKGNKNF